MDVVKSSPGSKDSGLPVGVRPSSGAASFACSIALNSSGARLLSWPAAPEDGRTPVVLSRYALCEQVNSLRFGVVQIIVRDSKVVQIERTEKARIARPQPQL